MISQTAEYALRAVVFLARNNDRSFPAHEIAEATKVPPGYLSKVLQSLARAGMVSSQRGLGGGFVLSVDPATITMLSVLQATDTSIERITECPLGMKGHENLCALHRKLDIAIAQVHETLESNTIADFVNETDGVRPLCETSEHTQLSTSASSKESGQDKSSEST